MGAWVPINICTCMPSATIYSLPITIINNSRALLTETSSYTSACKYIAIHIYSYSYRSLYINGYRIVDFSSDLYTIVKCIKLHSHRDLATSLGLNLHEYKVANEVT